MSLVERRKCANKRQSELSGYLDLILQSGRLANPFMP